MTKDRWAPVAAALDAIRARASRCCAGSAGDKSHEFFHGKGCLSILKQSEVPIAAPSANMSNAVSTLRAVDVHKEFGSKIKMILDTNKIKIGLESTVIKFG